MKLQKILYKVNLLQLIGNVNIDILNVQFDSRKIESKGLFIAIRGNITDGHKYIEEAISRGAQVIIVETIPKYTDPLITYVKVQDTNKALSIIAANFYNNPSERIKLIGVTGTNGKTTIVNLLHQLFGLLNIRSGMLSTINNKIMNEVIPSTHTTPDALQINFLLNKMIEQECEYCFMEVSSHSISQKRVNGLDFTAGIFTNISHEHLDYHNTFEEYIDVKKSFFDCLSKSAFILVNKDDKNGMKMLEGTKASQFSYALRSVSDYKCKVLESQFDGMLLNINKIDVWVKLIGDFNAYNLLAVYATAKQFGFSDNEVLTALSLLETASGRFECLKLENLTAIVDYAHTDDALKNILSTINSIRNNTEQVITVIGCGGDRDKLKRPLIASVACSLSTQVILTSDNPRSENPEDIIEDMIKGLDPIQKRKVLVIVDRRQAIKTACKLANSNDIILIAGKGHEKYQEINGEKLHFDDMQELKKTLNIKTK